MAFWDEYQEIGGNWIKSDEKQVLIENGIPIQVLKVQDDDGNKYGPRFALSVLVPDAGTGENEERSLGFPKDTVESRDRMLTQLQSYLQRDDAEPVFVKLETVGRSILVRNAEAVEA